MNRSQRRMRAIEKIHNQQDQETNGHAEIKPTSESGERMPVSRSQVELEEHIADLEHQRSVLVPQLQDTILERSELEKRNAHLEAKLQEISEQYQQAAVLIAQQQNEINQLNGELIVYLRQVVANQHQELERLRTS